MTTAHPDPRLEELHALIKAKSGAPPVMLDDDGVRARLGHDIAEMRRNRHDPSIIAEHEATHQHLEQFLAHPQFGHYLRCLTPPEVYLASGVRVLPLDTLRRELHELAPGRLLLPHGCIPFATSIGGNAICFQATTGRIVWADSTCFSAESICYKDPVTQDYTTVRFSAENLGLALPILGNDLVGFLSELLTDRMERRLDLLD